MNAIRGVFTGCRCKQSGISCDTPGATGTAGAERTNASVPSAPGAPCPPSTSTDATRPSGDMLDDAAPHDPHHDPAHHTRGTGGDGVHTQPNAHEVPVDPRRRVSRDGKPATSPIAEAESGAGSAVDADADALAAPIGPEEAPIAAVPSAAVDAVDTDGGRRYQETHGN
ncbi:uncharacterized protein LOC62_02G002597 [Vanrija pseudolonga]|uniref:Uncharacterized protein n=1 Tax=Vanrija pseudolonga TaxID=143232 RepID=A0AAF0Y2T9_9TREE|nr:hypothetical protein LOC62_02G002597 [Vanrija pseudolonga]